MVSLSSKDLLPDLLKDNKRHIQIIGLLISFKGIMFDNKEQQKSFIVRNLRDAKVLVNYSDERIIKIMKLLKDYASFDWKLSTVVKYIDTPNPEKNCFFGKSVGGGIIIG